MERQRLSSSNGSRAGESGARRLGGLGVSLGEYNQPCERQFLQRRWRIISNRSGGFDPAWGTGAQPYTSPVGGYPANAYGLFDMAGNVAEWCWDRYNASYYASSPAADPNGPSGPGIRVLRGGYWGYYARSCRAGFRNYGSPGYSENATGFRPVRTNNGTSTQSANTALDTRDWVNLTIIANGTTDPAPGEHQVQKNALIDITAIAPAPGYLPFSNWTGAVTGTTNPVTVTMDGDKTVTAVFEPDLDDSDDDGLTNYQEHVVYHSNPNLQDSDGDGFHDGYEVEHGYNPIIATSKPDTRMVIYTAVEVRFGAGEGKSYRIESSFDNTHWTPVESGIPGTGGEVTRFYTMQAMPKRFFRAVEE